MLTTANPYKAPRLAKFPVYHTFYAIHVDMTGNSGMYQLNEHLHIHTGPHMLCEQPARGLTCHIDLWVLTLTWSQRRCLLRCDRCVISQSCSKVCQCHGSGLALRWNGRENQINPSLLTVAGFDPI